MAYLRKLIFFIAIVATIFASPAFAKTSNGSNCVSLTKNLRMGMTGADVKALQLMLNMNPATTIAESGPGSTGNESTYFGKATLAAVIRYQEIYKSVLLTPAGLSAGTGFVGSLTRAHIAKNCEGTPSSVSSTDVKPDAGTPIKVTTPTKITTPVTTTTPAVGALGPVVASEPKTVTGVFTPMVVTSPWMNEKQFGELFVLMTNNMVVKPGTPFMIYGTGFTPDTPNTVHIGDGYSITNVGVDQNGLINIVFPADAPKGRNYIWVSNSKGTSNKTVFIIVPTPGQTGPALTLSSPSKGKAGMTVTVYGSGFSSVWNDIHFPTKIIPGVKSTDGKSLVFTIPTVDLGAPAESLALAPDISSTFSVVNDYGVSNNQPFTIFFK